MSVSAPSRSAPAAPVVEPRGPISAEVLRVLARPVGEPVAQVPVDTDDPLGDDDLQLALYLCYELGYRGVEGADERWEWDLGLLGLRARLEQAFEDALRDEVGPLDPTGDITGWLQSLLGGEGGPSLSGWCAEHATHEHLAEEATHRSLWQRKEADPHSWLLPRLDGAPKAALVQIQADEYGQGVLRDMHSELFALTMERLGLDPTYGAYLDVVPAPTIATVNMVSLCGLHRRLRGAAVGHLALFEMASVAVMSEMDAALRRLGFDSWTRLFFATHVVADAEHQTLAAEDLAGGLVAQDPRLETDIMFGAAALGRLEARATAHILGAWDRGETSLRRRIDVPADPPGLTEDRAPADDPRR